MSDWRSKPRTGRHEFMKFFDEISSRMEAGETQKQLYDDLKNRGMPLSYSQFNRHVKKYILREETGKKNAPSLPEIPAGRPELSEDNQVLENYSEDDWRQVNVRGSMLLGLVKKYNLKPADLDGMSKTEVSEYLTGLHKGNQ